MKLFSRNKSNPKDRAVDPYHAGHKMLPFRTQRALAAFAIAILLISFSVAVIWNHIDGITSFTPIYRVLAKAGLAMVELTAIIFLCWELWARDKTLSMACYVAEFLLVIVMLVHAGAVLQLDASGSQQKATLSAVAEAQATIAAAREKARIEAAGQQAAELNRMGQRQTARRIVQSAGQSDSTADNALLGQVVNQTRPNTFLPAEYLNGGMYYWPPMIAFVLFMLVLLISKAAVPVEDVNRNGIPDWMEPWAHRGAPSQSYPAAAQDRRQIGFPTSPQAPNHTFTFGSPAKQPEADDPKGPPPSK